MTLPNATFEILACVTRRRLCPIIVAVARGEHEPRYVTGSQTVHFMHPTKRGTN
jgi:hypothetical protein